MKSRVLVPVIAVSVAFLVITAALNYSGFCISQGRFLSEGELIDIGARRYLKRFLPLNYDQFAPTERPVAFASVEEFLLRNPDCCSVTQKGRDDGVPALFHRIMGRFAGFVRIEYKLEETPPEGPAREVVWVAVANCGRPWNGINWGR
ncbi:hypothetical protein [Dongia deserti]|uniref:hypothetical protein n=1 Tax=Dongia deserti TaxID=2268030 RepID=UPI0013C45DFC|nr:hypothetical protein [Dongia deserti]